MISIARLLTIIPLVLLSILSSVQSDSLNSHITPDEVDSLLDYYLDNAKESIRPHYSLDRTLTKRLALTEQHLVSALADIADKMPFAEEDNLCYIYLSKYLSEFKQDTEAVKGEAGLGRANMVADNPILTLKMIRRILVTLMKDTLGHCSEAEPTVAKTVDETFTAEDLVPPTGEDLDEALVGLLRIQYVYGLNATSELRLGNLNGQYTGAFLYFDDCLALGKKAVEMEADAMAYQWLTSAPLSPSEILSPQEHLNEDMWDLEETWLKLLNLTLLGDWELMHERLRDKRQEKLKDFFDYVDYATCRGEITQPIEIQSSLICFNQFDWDPYFYINPVKTEVLSEDPVILQFYDFVNPETIDFIRKSAANAEYNHDPRLVTLNRRTEKLIAFEVHKKGASYMQIASYGSLGGHYDYHNDAIQGTTASIHETGDRIATFLMFLSDVSLGGYTAFPLAGVYAKPVKGSAILWYSFMLNGKEDERTKHDACPVILGTQEVANRWIFQYENMWKHPCSPYPDE